MEFYSHPDDVELCVAGGLETPEPGNLAGPTYTCIWLKQFKKTRAADRLFYDHEEGYFTLEQVNEIRKASVSKLYCHNAHGISRIQANPFMITSAT